MIDRTSIGHTPLVPLLELAGGPLEATVLIKDESANPTGTHKDRKSAWIVERALQEKIDTLAMITSGNGGYSLARMAEQTGLRVATIISDQTRPSIEHALRAAGAEVYRLDLRIPLSSDNVLEIVRQRENEKIWDVSNDQEAAYKSIIHEIAHEIPDLVVAPLGSGELYMGLHLGMKECDSDATLIGVEVDHPVSKADKLVAHHGPMRMRIMHMQIEDACRNNVGKRGRWGVLESEIDWCIAHAPPGLMAEPSALVVFAVMERLRASMGKTVLINTGQGLQ